MINVFTNVFSKEELDYLHNHSMVYNSSNSSYFSIPSTDLICNTLHSRFGLDVPVNFEIPMRWIIGDTPQHVDVGLSNFTNTYLIYLNDSPGTLIIDSQSYSIQHNTGFMFNEGLPHETKYTENVPRLLIGPFNELMEPVGLPPSIIYYETETDALNDINSIEISYNNYTINYTINDSYTSWRIASNSTGTSSQINIYINGNNLNNDGIYYLYPSTPCFLEGTTVLCSINNVDKYVSIEELKNGTLVKTYLDGYKKIKLIGKGIIKNPGNDTRIENRLYKCTPLDYHQLKNDLYITGGHSILESVITQEQKDLTIKHLGKLFFTDTKYRLIACIDERAKPWNSEGQYTIWHFALENNNDAKNYGIYVNGGLLVESCSIRFLKEKANMELH